MKKIFLFVLLTQLFACMGPVFVLDKDNTNNRTNKCSAHFSDRVLSCLNKFCPNGFVNIEIQEQPITLVRCK